MTEQQRQKRVMSLIISLTETYNELDSIVQFHDQFFIVDSVKNWDELRLQLNREGKKEEAEQIIKQMVAVTAFPKLFTAYKETMNDMHEELLKIVKSQ